jgi:signal transduction histidine kinase
LSIRSNCLFLAYILTIILFFQNFVANLQREAFVPIFVIMQSCYSKIKSKNSFEVPGNLFRIVLLLFLISLLYLMQACQPNPNQGLKESDKVPGDENARLHLIVKTAHDLLPFEMDSAFQLLNEASALKFSAIDSLRADYLNALGIHFWYSGKYDSAIETFRPIISMNKTPEMLMRLARANNNIGSLYLRIQEFDSAGKYLHQALEIDRERGNEHGIAKTFYDLGSLSKQLGRYELALQYHLQSIATNEQLKDSFRLAHGYNALGNIYFNINDIQRAIEAYEKAIEFFEASSRKGNIIMVYNNLAGLLASLEQYVDQAIAYAEKGIKASEIENDSSLLYLLYSNIGTTYNTIKDSEKALQYLNKALRSVEPSIRVKELDGIYNSLASAHFFAGNFDSTKYYANKGLEIAEHRKSFVKQSQSLFLLARADSAMNNFRQAYINYHKATALRDSTWNLDNRNRISELQIIYETERKTAENQHLIDRNKLNDKIITNQRITIYLVIAVLILTVFVLLREHALKQKISAKAKKIKAQNEEIEQQNIKLIDLDNTKNKFISIVSHDLRGPFSSLLGLLEILTENFEKMSDKEKRNMIEVLQKSSINTYNLLVNLLEWSMAQSKKIENHPEKVDLFTITENVFGFLDSRAKLKNITLLNQIPDFSFAHVDPNIAQNILINLINNAIKFSHPNSIVRVNSKKGENTLQVCVIDQGIGIPAEKKDVLFQLDSNFKRPGTAKEPGTGLGLIVVKEFLGIVGGTISVESEPEKGSTVCFTLPLHP